MKTDRRGFFKFGAGAAVAGPQVVSEVAKKIAEGGIGNKLAQAGYIGGLSDKACIEASPDQGYWRETLARCTADLANLDAPNIPPKHERNWQAVAAQHIDGLRSVSASHKARMMVDEIEAVRRMAERSWVERRIEEAKKYLGPLGSLL